MANARFYSSIAAVTNLQVTANPSDTSIQVASSSGFPGSFPFTLSLDYGSANEELVDVTSGGPNIFTVTRAVDGTSASSHNAGAIVRHVSSARDFTELQSHIAADADVHGVTGDLVGATMTQTLTNKTLTAPTINNPTVGGTIEGTPTFDDSVTFTSGLEANSSVLVQRALTGDNAYRARVSGDTNSRFVVDADGELSWGPGNATMDTNLYRLQANVLQTDDQLNVLGGSLVTRPGATNSAVSTSVTGDTNARLTVRADGRMSWGPGNAGADTTLYRSAADTLHTDDNLDVDGSLTVDGTATVGGNLSAANIALTGQTWETYTPTVIGGGAATFSTQTGYYYVIGDMVMLTIYLVIGTAGTGSSNVQVNAPTSIDRSTRQVMGLSSESMGVNGHGHVVSFTGSSGATFDRMRTYDGQNFIGSDLFSGGLITIQGWYRKA